MNPGKKSCDDVDDEYVVLKGSMAIVKVPLGSKKGCSADGSCTNFSACAAGKFGNDPPTQTCSLCPEGWFSFKGAISCLECEAGKFSAGDGNAVCSLCDKDTHRYSDEVGSTSCKTCSLAQVSIGTGCSSVDVNFNLPVPTIPTIVRPNATSSWGTIDIAWRLLTKDDGDAATRPSLLASAQNVMYYDLQVGTTTGFIDDASTMTYVDVPTASFRHIDQRIDVRASVLFARVRVIDVATGDRGQWSGTTLPWLSTGSSACVDDKNFLDTQSLEPTAWACAACPQGGDCSGSITNHDLGPLPGWWQIPQSERVAPQEMFARCMYESACVGIADRNANTSRTPCDTGLGFQNHSRLCNRCRKGYRRMGLDRCSKCPEQGANWTLMMLGALVLVGVLVFMSGTAISSAGQQKLSESVQKILLNYLQVVTMARSFPLRWPHALEGLFDFQGAFSTVGDHLVNPDCVSDTATAAELVYNKQAVFAFMPLITVGVAFAFWYVLGSKTGKPFYQKRAKPDDTTPKDKFIVTVGALLFLVFPTLVGGAFKLFDCRTVGNSRYLQSAMDEECYVGRHLVVVVLLGCSQLLACEFHF